MHANLHLNAISRSAGRNATSAAAYRSGTSLVACAAYRACEKLYDQRYEKTHDYSRKQNVIATGIITPEHAPQWMNDRGKLWNAVEAGEKRKDAQLAKEAVLVLPRNLSSEQHEQVVRDWIKDNLSTRNLVADYAIHSPDASDGGKNPHAHVMFTLRPVEQDGSFGKKLTGYKNGGLDGREFLESLRFSYQDHLNQASAENDHNAFVFDLRSYRDRGIDKTPQPKMGPKVTHMSHRGYDMDRTKELQRVMHRNQIMQGYREHKNTYQMIGGGSSQPAFVVESIRADIAEKYYEFAYGHTYDRDDEYGWER